METNKIISICLSISIFLCILLIAVFSSILKEGVGKLYSFHRFQLWIWTLIILPCFVLNWGFINTSAPTIGITELILLGISSANSFTAEIISDIQLKSSTIKNTLKTLSTNSKGFWYDILTDDKGELSIGRLQQLMFTITYVIIYVSMFFPKKIFPVFDSNAFILMGISNATFLTCKGLKK